MSEIRTDYSNIHFKDNGKLKLLIIVGTRPEIIRLAAVINKCRKYFDVILAHTGQNYDYTLNGIFFDNLKIANPEVYMDAVGDDLGATADPGRYQQLSVRHRGEASAYSDLPHGSGKPLQGRVPAGGDKPADRGYHFRCKSGLQRACQKISS